VCRGYGAGAGQGGVSVADTVSNIVQNNNIQLTQDGAGLFRTKRIK
jgi:hypothetical protein